MNLVALNIDTIPLGSPLPFALRGADGVLLAKKGYVIRDRADLESLIARGQALYLDTLESGDNHRAYLSQLQEMLRSDTDLGQIATMKISANTISLSSTREREREKAGPMAWHELQLHATQLLRSPQTGDFAERFFTLHNELAQHAVQAPDAALLALIHLSAQEIQMYSATHAMLVALACMLTARETLRWPELRVEQIGHAALSMNIAMTAMQDQLAQQTQPLSGPQITAIDTHPMQSAAMLHHLGVVDHVWLDAVRLHHQRTPGPMAQKSEAEQIARLIQRADVFGARISPRASRLPMPVTAAMQASYYDENQQVDEAGAALVKTLGIYPPGALVRLASQEVGIVLRRGHSATTPRVAVVVGRSGMPTGELIPRDTAQANWKITGPVAHKSVRVSWPLERILALV